MSSTTQHGGKRQGAGRPKGSLSKRSIEAIEAVAERFPNWSPLLHFATVANDDALPADVRLDAAKAAAPFIHPRPKGIELDAEAAVDLEGRIAAARAHALVKEGLNPLMGLAERIDRAKLRQDERAASVVSVLPPPPRAECALIAEPTPAPAAPPPPKPAPPPAPAAQGDWNAPAAYSPILPAAWPERPAFADCDYQSLESGLIGSRNR